MPLGRAYQTFFLAVVVLEEADWFNSTGHLAKCF